jgi:phosphatidylethanolamine/phosphatidyl-N-methylethanolamine N-methyltransferase
MTQPFSAIIERYKRIPSERWLFFRRALVHPLRLGTLVPSSRAVGRLVAAQLKGRKPGYVVEVGGGTGVITRALLAAGVSPDRLLVVEIDPEMADYLRRGLRGVRVVTGDALKLSSLLPAGWVGRVDTVISGVPMTMLSVAGQRELIDAFLAVLAPTGRYLQYTHSMTGSPVRTKRLGLKGKRLGTTLGNFPPASVYTYRRAEGRERS